MRCPRRPESGRCRENRWLAARYGVDALLIVEDADHGKPVRRSVRELVPELLEELSDTAAALGIEADLADVLDILANGSGSIRQRRLVEGGATLRDVVNHLVEELANDRIIQA